METFTDHEIEYAKAYMDLSRQRGRELNDLDWERLRKIRAPWGIDIRRSNQIVSFVDKYGVEAMQTSSPKNNAGNYSIVLKSVGSEKLQVIKLIKELFDIGLNDAKVLTDSVPTVLGTADSKSEAEFVKESLENLGARVEISGSENQTPKAKASDILSKDMIPVYFDKIAGNLLSIHDNGSDVFYTSLDDSLKGEIRNEFDISLDDEIIFFRDTSSWNTRDNGLVITDTGIIGKPDDETYIKYDWGEIKSVIYKDMSIYIDTGEGYVSVPGRFWLKSPVENDLRKLAENLDSIASKVDKVQGDDDIKFQEFIDAVETEQDINSAYKILNDFESKFGTDNLYYPYMRLKFEVLADDSQSIIECADTLLEIYDDNLKDIKKEAYKFKAQAQYKIGEYQNARHSFFKGTDNPSVELKTDKLFKDIDAKYYQTFFELPYNKRKIIAVSNSVTDLTPESFEVVDIHKAGNFSFPIGHPVSGQLYVGHPFVKDKYLPIDTYDLELLEDRLREFCYVVQSLGAVEVAVESINGGSLQSVSDNDSSLSANASAKINSGSGSVHKHSSVDAFEDFKNRINFHQYFTPAHKPYLPENLVWYSNEPSWQRLFNQRMNGGLLEHHENISTSKNKVVSSKEYLQIDAEFKALFYKVGGGKQNTSETTLTERSNVELAIYVKFAPIDAYDNLLTNNKIERFPANLSASEQQYKDEILFCLEDGGSISDDDRKYLERKRVKFGISLERAAEIEKSCAPQLTDSEKEYLETFKEMTGGKEMTERIRRILDRERESLGITKERAGELEKMQ